MGIKLRITRSVIWPHFLDQLSWFIQAFLSAMFFFFLHFIAVSIRGEVSIDIPLKSVSSTYAPAACIVAIMCAFTYVIMQLLEPVVNRSSRKECWNWLMKRVDVVWLWVEKVAFLGIAIFIFFKIFTTGSCYLVGLILPIWIYFLFLRLYTHIPSPECPKFRMYVVIAFLMNFTGAALGLLALLADLSAA